MTNATSPLYFDSTLEVEDIRSTVQSYTRWYHRFEFPGGVTTPSQQQTPLVLRSLEEIGFPQDASGLRALDVGCCDGLYSFLLEKRGAEVVSVDYRNVKQFGFGIAQRIIGSTIEPQVDTIYNITPEKYGLFDIVLFLGVLYHLRHPILGLDRMRSMLKPGGRLFLETHMLDKQKEAKTAEKKAMPIAYFYKRDAWQGNYTNYFGPNQAAVDAWLDAAEFTPTGFSSPTPGRGCFAAIAVEDPISAKYRDLEWGIAARSESGC
jgi:tRNA (mo5U34)-methyltransferase